MSEDIRTQQHHRIAALPFNPFFEEEANKLRQKYSIPEDGKEAWRWLEGMLHRYDKTAFALFFNERESRSFGGLAVKRINDTEVPLEREILIVLRRFGLPQRLFRNIQTYVVTGDRLWLDLRLMQPKVKVRSDFEKGQEITVTISGLSLWTTKQQWGDIWNRNVKEELEITKRDMKDMFGVVEPSRKQATPETLYGQMQRWSEWYQLSEVQGLRPSEALDEWEEAHPEQRGDYDLSTVTKAITEFREILNPIPDID
ncbi:hypothetical protein ACFLYX_02205 [Chloroflexota bacterium]